MQTKDTTHSGVVLAIECSSVPCTLAWSVPGDPEIRRMKFDGGRMASIRLIGGLERLMAGGIRPDTILVGRGPGSYSGLRSALCAATGLAAALGARVHAVNSLFAMGMDAATYHVAGDAGRGMIFLAEVDLRAFSVTTRLFPAAASALALGEMAEHPLLVLPSLPEGLAFGSAQAVPDAGYLIGFWIEHRKQLPEEPLEPIYLQAPVADVPGTVCAAN